MPIYDGKKVKKAKYRLGEKVKFSFLKSDKKYPITKKEYRFHEKTWAYKVNGKWWNEKSICKRRRKK